MKTNLALIYIRNGEETVFPAKDIDHAVRLADAIAESDLLDDSVGYNCFDFCYFSVDMRGGKIIGDCWEDGDGRTFDEYWSDLRYGKEV